MKFDFTFKVETESMVEITYVYTINLLILNIIAVVTEHTTCKHAVVIGHKGAVL